MVAGILESKSPSDDLYRKILNSVRCGTESTQDSRSAHRTSSFRHEKHQYKQMPPVEEMKMLNRTLWGSVVARVVAQMIARLADEEKDKLVKQLTDLD